MSDIDYEAADKVVRGFMSSYQGDIFNYELYLSRRNHTSGGNFIKATAALREIAKKGLEHIHKEDPALIATALLIEGCPKANDYDQNQMLKTFRDTVVPTLRSITQQKVEQPVPKVDTEQYYQALRLDLPNLMYGPNMSTYTQLQHCYPTQATLLNQLAHGTVANLDDDQIDSLLKLPDLIRTNGVFTSAKTFLLDYEKVSESLRALKVAYTQPETDLRNTLNKFWRKHGHKLEFIDNRHYMTKQRELAPLHRFIALGKKLNCGPSWAHYNCDPAKLRAIFVEALALSSPRNHPDYMDLIGGKDTVNKTQQVFGNNTTENNALSNADSDLANWNLVNMIHATRKAVDEWKSQAAKGAARQ